MTLTCSVAFEKYPIVWPVQPPETPVVCAQAKTLKTRKRGRSKERVKTATQSVLDIVHKCF